jgi:chromosome segregation ATPase
MKNNLNEADVKIRIENKTILHSILQQQMRELNDDEQMLIKELNKVYNKKEPIKEKIRTLILELKELENQLVISAYDDMPIEYADDVLRANNPDGYSDLSFEN